MKFNSKDRTEMLKVRVSEEEKTLIQADDLAIANLRARMCDIMRAQYKIRDLITKKLDLDVWQRINRNKL